MNILSFDIEEWYIEKKFCGDRAEKYREFDSYLNKILDILDEKNQKATFFCLGRIATDFHYVIRKISERGHEIGCHSNEHLWLTQMTPKQLQEDTKEAIDALQDVSGQSVVSYRAPAFSIGEKNKWVIEILAECGIERDSSIYPAVRDFGGFPAFPANNPVLIEYNNVQLKEFPIALTHMLGKDFAFSGGGYFRLFPLQFIKYKMFHNNYFIAYFHIGDLIHNQDGMMTRKEYETYFRENGSVKNRMMRYVKSSIGTKGAFEKMQKLLNSASFVSLEDADNQLTFENKILL